MNAGPYGEAFSKMVINGVEIYPTGAILSKVLESLEKGVGVIKVLVMLR